VLIQKFFLKSKILDKYFAIFTTLIIIFYFLNAVLFSKNTFNNHLFLLFTEAKQFLDYKVLYKEIHVLYGVGQALFNALSLYFFGPNVFSIQLNANIFYFFSIFFILLICLKLNLNRFDSLFLILIIINLHPIPLLAWSTYLAFLPLVMSLYFALEKKKINLFFSGLLLAIACLNRETILLSAVIIFFYITYEFVLKNKNIAIFNLYLLGFSFVLTIFTIYMFVSLNYLIWLELIYPLNRWQSLINIGYYIQTDITPLRKFYIFVFAPYREIFFTFLKSIYNFWPHWILIFTSYFSCIFILFIRITKNKFLDENEHLKYSLSIISIYSLSLILQNIHQVGIDRVATGSVLGLIVLFFIYSKVVKNHKIRILFYIIILLFFFIRPYDTFNKVNLKELYKLSFYNIKNNINFYFHNQKSLNNYKKIPEFKFMNYNQSVHEFYTKVQEICEDLRIIKGVKYSDNQTPFWELSYFCKTQPKYYYVLPSTAFSEENFKKSQFKYNSNNINTVEFHVSNDIGLKEEDYIDIRGFTKKRYLKDFKIIHIFDLREKYPDMYKDYKIRYLFFIQKIK
jgi:hypothetical protein